MAILTINRGIVTSPNELTKPDGAADILDNCVIDFDNMVQSRRGFGEFGIKTSDDSVVKQLLTYKGRILRHFTNKLEFDSTGNGNFLSFSGSYTELVNRLRIKYFELNGNLYFTTNEGIKKISAVTASDFTTNAGFVTNAGAVKALGIEGTIVPSVSGFLPAQSKVGYKVLWAKKDANGNIIRGVPSSRFVATNTSKDINTGEKFEVSVTNAGAGIHKEFNSTTAISDGNQITFSAADVNITDNTINLTTGSTDHNYQTNDVIKLLAGAFTLPTGLTAGNYYVIRVNTNKIKLKNTIEGSEIDITATGTGGIVESTDVGKTITINLHGYTNDTKVRLYGEIPEELNDKTVYYIVNATTNTFQLAPSQGGTAIVLTKKEGISNIYSGLSSLNFFTFDSPTNKFACWFNVSGTDDAPTDTLLVGRNMREVEIYKIDNKTKENYMARIAQALSLVSDVEVSATSTEVTVTNRDGGNVLNASAGNIDASFLTISDIIDGQTAVGSPANVTINFTVPTEIITSSDKQYFYEVYRTAPITVATGLTLNDIDPGEEFQKIAESPVVENNNPIPQSITFIDEALESFRLGGIFLYTNPVTGESALQSNEPPPIAHDVAVFKGSAFYANTKERHRLQFTLLSVSQLISGTSKLYIGNSQVLREYTFVGVNQIVDFTVKRKAETVGGSYFDIMSAQNLIKYRVWFDKGIITKTFTQADINATTEFITITNHGLANNDKITISGASLPGGLTAGDYYIKSRTDNTFQLSLSPGGATINLSTASGTATLTHTSIAPTADSTLLLKVVFADYSDTIQGSVDAFISAFFDVLDFVATSPSSGVVRLTYQDNGAASAPTQSTPATGWITPTIFQPGLGENPATNTVLLSGLASEGLSTGDSARSLERVINKDVNSPVTAYYVSGPDDLPGNLVLEAKSLTDDPFYLAFSDTTTFPVFEPSLPVAKIVNNVSNTGIFTTTTAHQLTANQLVYTFVQKNSTVVVSGRKTIATTPLTTTYTLAEFTAGTAYASPFTQAVVFPADVVSDNAVNPNRVYFSKINQPEAVPLVNFIDIGPKDKAIQRIMALRDSLVVLKEDGVYIISGSSAPNFSVRLSDSSALTFAPDTATNLNNLIYVLTSQGVVTVSETGVGVISRNIENKLQEIANAKFDYKLMSWGMASESDRCYLLYLPEKTSDLYTTQAFRYNTFTRTWTRWTKPANCGVVNPADDKIYLGDASGRPYVLKERKNFERQDYADREIVRAIGANAVNGLSLTISSVAELEKGDSLVQYQYLNINKFNRLLKKLDRDSLLSSDYISLKAFRGDSLAAKLTSLVAKLNADGIAAPASSGSDFVVNVRDDFNAIINFLNLPTTATNFKNYKTANELLFYETIVTSVDPRTNSIVIKFVNNFVQGDVSFFKAIKCLVQYSPQHFGKPEATKQVPDGTFVFEQNNFWGGTVAYASDRSYDFASIEFNGKGPGYWDGYSWANVTFGGEGNEVPVRTLIPRDKSRCRYLHVRFIHTNAREEWKLIGVSLEPREVSTRGYR